MGGGGVNLFSEDDGVHSRHKKTKTKVEKLGHMKFRGHSAEIKNKSEIPSLEKFIGMKVLHSRSLVQFIIYKKKGEGRGRGLKRGETLAHGHQH